MIYETSRVLHAQTALLQYKSNEKIRRLQTTEMLPSDASLPVVGIPLTTDLTDSFEGIHLLGQRKLHRMTKGDPGTATINVLIEVNDFTAALEAQLLERRRPKVLFQEKELDSTVSLEAASEQLPSQLIAEQSIDTNGQQTLQTHETGQKSTDMPKSASPTNIWEMFSAKSHERKAGNIPILSEG